MIRNNKQMWPAGITSVCLVFACIQARAANPEFQNFFFDACTNPTGALAARCGETTGGLGDLSGDSESSLNPSQTLTNADLGLASASSRSKEARERAERLRGDQPDEGDSALDIGPFSLLINARGRFDENDREVDIDAERGYESDSYGLEVGLDYRVNDRVIIGALATWETSEVEFDQENPGVNFTPASQGAGETEGEALGLTLFGSVNVSDHSYLEGSIGYISSDLEFTRNSVFQESNRAVPQTDSRVEGDTDGDEIWASANWGYIAERGGWTLSPYVGATYSRSKVDGYTESDTLSSGLALNVDGIKRTSLLAHAGLRISGGISTKNAVWIPHLRAEYQHEFDRDKEANQVSLELDASQNAFRFEGDSPDRDFFNVGVGLAAIFPNGWIPFVDFQLLVAHSHRDSYRISAGLRKEL